MRCFATHAVEPAPPSVAHQLSSRRQSGSWHRNDDETQRRKEIEEANKKTASKTLDTKVSKEGLVEDDLSKLKDEPLREGLLILSDILTKHIG